MLWGELAWRPGNMGDNANGEENRPGRELGKSPRHFASGQAAA